MVKFFQPKTRRGRRQRSTNRPGERAGELAQLVESRRIIVEAFEIERRRIERDLHDGTQQYLVTAAMKVGEAQLSGALAADPELAQRLQEAQAALQSALDSLRATVRGIHPQVLVDHGLAAALQEVAASYGDHVRIVVPHSLPTIPSPVLAAAYFFTTEALANAAKHAPGAPVTVLVNAGANLRVSVVDQGPGGAHVRAGGGLEGMGERLATFGGELEIVSPAGGPTQVSAEIPLLLRRGERAAV